MKCKFEERQYEQPLNFELAWRGKIFPAGQVLENTIGIDAALFSRDPTFWRLWNTQRWWLSFRRLWKHGVRLKSELWEDAKNKLDNVKFPKFKCNVFIQHKRPEYITSPRGREFNFWRQKYFRYDINTDQRDILSKLEQRISHNSIVTYACPAFYKFEELWNFQDNSELVENSNFVQPHKLINHRRYTFINGGKDGQGFSEPTYVEGIEILKEIEAIFVEGSKSDTNTIFIYSLASAIREVIRTYEQGIAKIYYAIMKKVEFSHELERSLAEILAFVWLTNITWTIGMLGGKFVVP